ncbi:efflux RND transporter periplasmic adaptor subunit [Actomonas aquatica]|uniref:Efflux RND transporter periplasmic adaptor subunit n=1 Tax=Actomonas aquatica TaxID=2866162 RepID=A0ABZ1C3Y6_9BACT|nr:efflux RND transporter periplasmic adaptor subunit [Opitutus sp. WL0086]WRQ86075.1 efflux RND transporter periplasmic adaptor subunit [Opitutus sp. WL0086]
MTVSTQTFSDPIIAAGSIIPVNSVSLGFRVPGQIEAVLAADGEVVATGQVLARLDPAELRHAKTIAQAQADELSSRHHRLTQLFEAGSLTRTDFERSHAALTEAKAALDLANEQLDHTELVAPFAGKLLKHPLDVGAVVAPGVPVFTLMAEQPVWAEVHVAESQRAALALGQTVQLELPAMDSADAPSTLSGEIESIAATADPFSRTFAVRIRQANTDGRLRLGNLVTARIEAGRGRDGLLLPPPAVQREADGSLYVWLLGGDGNQVVKRAVASGGTQGEQVIIDQGLAAGDQVVVGTTAPLFDGREVKVVAP